jgi:hypothetical protein
VVIEPPEEKFGFSERYGSGPLVTRAEPLLDVATDPRIVDLRKT